MNQETIYDQFLKDPEATSVVPVKVLQKLQLLNHSLSQRELPLDTFTQLSPEEIESLVQLPQSAKLQLFQNIIGTFLKENKVTGTIAVLGKSSFFWNERAIEVDLGSRTMKLSRNDKRKEPHILDLQKYTLKKTGIKNNHYTVTLHALKKFKLDPSEIVLGTHIKEEIEHWTKVLSSCCQGDLGKSSVTFHEQKASIGESRIEEEKKVVQSPPEDEEESDQEIILPELDPEIPKLQPCFSFLEEKLNFRYLTSEKDFTTVRFVNGVRILQSKVDPCVFKVITSLPQFDIDFIADPASICQWNQTLYTSKVQVVVGESLGVVFEGLKNYGRFYKRRNLILQRGRFVDQDGTMFLIQQSTDSTQNSAWEQTGKMFYGVHGLFQVKQKQKILMVFETKINFMGRISTNQNTEMVLEYLGQYGNLKHYIKQFKIIQNIDDELNYTFIDSYKSFAIDRQSIITRQSILRESTVIGEERPVFQESPPLEKWKSLYESILRNEHWRWALHPYELSLKQNPIEQRLTQTPDGKHFFFGNDWVIDEKKGVYFVQSRTQFEIHQSGEAGGIEEGPQILVEEVWIESAFREVPHYYFDATLCLRQEIQPRAIRQQFHLRTPLPRQGSHTE